MEEKNTNKIAIALVIAGGLILLVFGGIISIHLSLAYLAEKEKTETLPTVTEETESDTIAFETTDSKVKINIGKIENIENVNIENVYTKEK